MPSATNLIFLEGAAHKPKGDVVLVDVAKEDASIVIADLKELEIPERGSIAIEEIDSHVSDVADQAEIAAHGMPTDAVVWEQVEARTSENIELSANFVVFMVLAGMLATIGILLDSPILIIGAMVVGPEFGPIAALCVAIVQRRSEVAKRSLIALAVGFPAVILVGALLTLAIDAAGLVPDDFSTDDHPFTEFVSDPGALSFLVAFIAGTAGVLSLTSTKSGALIGVLISVTTLPAAVNIGLAAAFGDWDESAASLAQLAINLGAIMLAGVLTLYVQRRLYQRRRRAHLDHEARGTAGLPMGESRRKKPAARA